MIISIKIPYLEKKEKIMLKTFLSLKNIQVSGANSNTIEMVKMQIIDQFENGEKKLDASSNFETETPEVYFK